MVDKLVGISIDTTGLTANANKKTRRPTTQSRKRRTHSIPNDDGVAKPHRLTTKFEGKHIIFMRLPDVEPRFENGFNNWGFLEVIRRKLNDFC